MPLTILPKTSLLVLALAGLAGCASLHGMRSQTVAQGGGAASDATSTLESVPLDAAITENVRSQLARDLPLSEIDVHTAQGKVELRGTVEDADAARRAVKGALAVEGVRGVVNDLDVSPDAAGASAALSAATL